MKERVARGLGYEVPCHDYTGGTAPRRLIYGSFGSSDGDFNFVLVYGFSAWMRPARLESVEVFVDDIL